MATAALRVIESGTAEMSLALNLPDDLTFGQWEQEGRRLSFSNHALQWFIGDWWNAGHRFGEERRAETAKLLFGLEYGTVRNYGSVAGRVPVSLRSDTLPFAHYREVAALPAETAQSLIARAVDESLTVQALRREVQAIKASNDTAAGHAPPIRAVVSPEPKPNRTELEEAHARYVEAMEELQAFRPLTKREADYLTFALNHLGEAHAERRPVPEDFEVVFVEQGRLACEPWFGASRITVNRWMLACGAKRLKDKRAEFVKHQRNMAHPVNARMEPNALANDPLLPVATMAADFLRMSRYGGWRISRCQDGGGWFVGSVRKSSEELLVMADRQGFDRAAAEAEATREGY